MITGWARRMWGVKSNLRRQLASNQQMRGTTQSFDELDLRFEVLDLRVDELAGAAARHCQDAASAPRLRAAARYRASARIR
eukprot:5486426-Pyramimonas_sp.AAC.1